MQYPQQQYPQQRQPGPNPIPRNTEQYGTGYQQPRGQVHGDSQTNIYGQAQNGTYREQAYTNGYVDRGYDQHYQQSGARMRRDEFDRRPPPRQEHSNGYGSDYHDQPRTQDNYPRGPPQPLYNDSYEQRPHPPNSFYQQPQFASSSPDQVFRGPARGAQTSHSLDLQRGAPMQGPRGPADQRPHPLDRSLSAEHVEYGRSAQRRPLIEPVSPTMLPQDNAFPVFPTKRSPQKTTVQEDGRSTNMPPSMKNDSPIARQGQFGRAEPDDFRLNDRSPPMGPGSRPSPPQTQGPFGNFDMPIRSAPATGAGPRKESNGHHKTRSQSEIYANGYMQDIGKAMFSPPMSREDEIEAEMPNFDGPVPENASSYRSPMMVGQNGSAPQQGPRPGLDSRAFSGSRSGGPDAMLGPHPANQPPALSQYRDQYAPRDRPFDPRQPQSRQDAGYGPRAMPVRPGTADQYGTPSPVNQYGRPGPGSGMQQGPQRFDMDRTPSAPPPQTGSSFGMPLTQQRSNPDALPQHPVPIRPGLMEQRPNTSQSRGPSGSVVPATRTSSDTRRTSVNVPVSHAEISQLQALVNAHPQDAATALLLAKKLVEASHVLASENGRLDARSTAKNREKFIFDAHRRVKKLVSAGYPDAIFYLADCYGSGALGLEEDPKEAFNLYQQAAKLGHPQAAYRTAVCCELGPEEGGGTRRDVQKAVQWYRRAAQLQDTAAMFKLGVICLKGLLSQPRNIPEAERWLKRAAEKADKENPHALYELGMLYESEQQDREIKAKIIPDDKYAKELFFKAAQMGYKNSQFRLGQAYEYGALGLPVDSRNSIAWYSKAAAQGEHGAELALSGWYVSTPVSVISDHAYKSRYLTGAEGILENSDTEAYLWARKAASADPPLAKAMFAMGYYTETGIGCPPNLEEAKRWYGRAASYKFAKAIDRLEDIRKNGGKVSKELKGQRLQRKDLKEKVR